MRKLIVLTGSSRGLGYALYERLLSTENVELLCLSKNINDKQADLLNSAQGGFDFIEVDFSTAAEAGFESQLEAKISKSVAGEKYDEIIFISNAGVIEPIGMVGHLDSVAVKQATNVNFLAPMLISQVLVRLAESLSARLKIVNISSGAAKHAISGWSVYCATKSALVMFFDVMQKMPICEIEHVDPGVLNTGMQSQIRQASADDFPDVAAFKQMQQNGQLVAPSIVAKNIVEKIA